MDKQQAREIIRETFESCFDKSRFAGFIKNLLNNIEDASFTYQGNYIPDAYKQYIKSLERIGKFSDGANSIDILVITLQKETSLERARTMQRNFVAWYLNGSRGGEMKDAAMVAYVSPNEADWRFSLVKMDYRFEKSKTGKMKVREEFTPARRWSFLVGIHENSHTAQSRLVDILADDEHSPTLEELENGFDIETVTKEFFLKYRELFLRVKEELDRVVKNDPKIEADFNAQGVDTVNFAKKLLGQIVFLYFLQKKGWFGAGRDDDWGKGSKYFLRELFKKKHGDYNNFFDNILEPLFYEALRIDRTHDDDYYSRFNCKIPFLNGGLFDPIGNYDWVHTDINLPDALFSNTRKTREGDIGDGILDVFDRYNFTVREDEPLEKEVAIDPELLGKAYEKFNAIRPDNFDEFQKALKSGRRGEENKFNKKFGVYYTPREIVHYMCRQSLINYLHTRANEAKLSSSIKKTDIEDLIEVGELISEHEAMALIKQEKIKNGIQKSSEYTLLLSDCVHENAGAIDDWLADITVCDPAVGSGAFPVGMMNEIVRARNVLSVFLNDGAGSEYEFKRRCIEHSLYGVDIDPGAVEIAKLRLWLSLMVDEDDIKNIKPLPNLDYRIMQGNSLISEFMGINFDSDREKDTSPLLKDKTDELIELFQQKKDEFLNESNVSQKTKLKAEIDNLLVEVFETRLKTQEADFFNRLKNIENKYSVLPNEKQRNEIIEQEKQKLYKDSGFDLETAEKQLKEFTSGRQIKPFFLWNLYFSEVFYNKGGFDVVIANPPYIQLQKNGGALAKLYQKSGYKTFARTGDIYALFYEKGHQVLNNAGNLYYITSNKWMRAGYGKKLRRFFAEQAAPKVLIDFGDAPLFANATTYTNILILGKTANADVACRVFDLSREIDPEQNLLKNLAVQAGQFVPQFSDERYLIANQAELSINRKVEAQGTLLKEWDVKINYGIKTGYNEAFIINGAKRAELIAADPKSTEIIKPVLRGKDIKRYRIDFQDLWVINSHNGLKYKNIPPIDVPDNYPAIFEHLKTFLPKCKKRADQGNHWTNIRSCAYIEEFDKEKIVWGNLNTNGAYAFENVDAFIIAPSNLLTSETESVKYLVALLNSRLMFFVFKDIAYSRGGKFFEFKKVFVEQLPIIKADKIVRRKLEALVDQIQAASPTADVAAMEAEIDQLVYKLYGLTDKEIKIVEGGTKTVGVKIDVT